MRGRSLLRLIGLVLCFTCGSAARSQAEETDFNWDGIQRLQVDLSAHEASPFLQLGQPVLGASPDRPKRDSQIQPVSHLQAVNSTPESSKVDPVAAHRQELRETLAREGKSSLEGRDSLTSEAMSVFKWTIVTLVMGALAAVGLKKYQSQKEPHSGPSTKIRVLETLQLGRQQGLKLVEVGGERFLIASDQAGIKAVTLLPSWPDSEEHEMNAMSPQGFVGEPRLFRELSEEVEREVV